MKQYNLDRLVYHPVTPEQVQTYNSIKRAIIELAVKLDRVIPDSRDKTLAFHQLELLRMAANKAIAVGEQPMFIESNPEPLADPWEPT